ncbi:fungal-specific transcription factor domain-containing protein [Flagelloscypha sp. PMI_526]|nr:fungal-specific transcription factor domain-containing protein [Flagelloscypha sp. PMI_526]
MDSNRRSERRGEAIASRMSRGLVACAECRRMKMKCDKKVPCSSCVKRGCSSICPTGKLAGRQESRTIHTEGNSGSETQDEIARLRERILQLEDALALSHSNSSNETHPLLVETSSTRPQENPDVDKVIEDLGTLAVGEAGEAKYYGPSAATETLYQAISVTDELPPSPTFPQSDLDSTVEGLSLQIPFGSTLDMESFVLSVISDLPERMRAWSLCEIFCEHYTIYSAPIQREELIQDYLSPVYKYLNELQADYNLPLPSTIFRPHRCAVMFFAFALGAWLDLTNEDYWVEADRYFQTGLSCLSAQSLFSSPEVASVQALFLLASYNEFRGAVTTTTLDSSWTIMSLGCKLAQGIGLHRDSIQWNFDEITVQRRRWLFWEFVALETLVSLGTGRPLSIKKNYVDAELPDDAGRTDARGQPLQGFFRWKHEALRDCYLDVVETLLSATPATYETIIELDRKVRAKEIPAHLNRILLDAEDGVSAREFMQSCLLGVVRSKLLLSIHRGYLTKALQDPSGNPLKSRYAPSFLASYRAASWIIKSFQATQKRFPILLPRLVHPWTNVITAAMVLGSIAISAPSSLVGSCPLEELRAASSIFDDAAARTVSHRTKNGAKIVRKILARAEEAGAHHSAGNATTVQSGFAIPPTNYGDDELAIFGGQTRLLPMKARQKAPTRLASASSNSSSSGSSEDGGPMEDVHQSLLDFLASAPVTQVASSTMFQDMDRTFEQPLVPLFDNAGLMPPLESWVQASLPIPPNAHSFGKAHGSSISGLQVSDMFENYVASTVPTSVVQEANIIDPWQDFMKQSFLIE